VATAVAGIDQPFYPAAWKVGLALGLTPEDAGYGVAKILYSESGISPSVKNSIGCVGINQFCPGSQPAGITVAAYAQLPASTQLLQYVWPFWANKIRAFAPNGISRAVDLYWLNWGVPSGHPFVKNAPGNYIVNSNVGTLDRGISGGKTYATVSDLQAWLDRVNNQTKWKAIHANLAPYAVTNLAALAGTSSLATAGIVGAAAAFWWFELRGLRR
jgi:hypothetical protein